MENLDTSNFDQILNGMYGQPGAEGALDLSFLYEGKVPYAVASDKVQARINAALIASSVNRSKVDPAEVFTQEYSLLENMTDEEQYNYAGLRIREEAAVAMQETYENFVAAATSRVLVPGSPEYVESENKAVERVVALETAKGTASTAAVINSSDKGMASMRRERVLREQLLARAMKQAGYDIDNLAPWNSRSVKEGLQKLGWWAKEFIPGKFVYETQKYDIGATHIMAIKKLSSEDRLARLEKTLNKAVQSGATAIELMDIASAFEPDKSVAATGIIQGLDIFDVLYTVPKLITKSARAVRQASILRKYTTPAGVAAEIGAPDVAARLSAVVLTEAGTSAGDTTRGLDKLTAALNASPFQWHRLDPAVVGNISHNIQEYIEDHRKLIHFYISKAINRYSAETAGFLRPGDREAAKANIISKLPSNAEVVESTPFGLGVRITTPNPDKFATPADLALAERRYGVWREEYVKVSDELDRLYKEAKSDLELESEWVARLERNKDKAKRHMDEAFRILTKGTKKDNELTTFIWYQRDKHTGQINGVLESNPIATKLISPDGYLRAIDDMLVPERTEILARQERLAVLFQKVVREAVQGLSKKNMERVGAVINFGSDNSRVFRADELMGGIEVPGFGTVRLNKKEVAAYYKARDMMDAAYGMRSLMKFKELGFKGFTKQAIINIPTSTLDTGEVLANPRKFFMKSFGYRTNADGTTTIVRPSADHILDATGGAKLPARVTSIRGAAWDPIVEKIQKGQAVLVQFEQPARVGNEMLNYGIIPVKRLKDISPDVLNFRKGYSPNIYKAPYAVRVHSKKLVDGRDQLDTYETVRFFGTRREGQAWIDAQTDGLDYLVDSDKEWKLKDVTYRAEVSDATFTGLYEDFRGVKIPFGPEGKDTPVESGFAAMDRYMDNLAWTYPLNDWREGVLARYFNTANDYLKVPNDLDSDFKIGLTTTQENALITLRNWVKDQLSIVSGNEMVFSRWMQQTAEHIEDSTFWQKVGKYVPYGDRMTEALRLKLLYGAENMDAFGWIRNAGFRTYLGYFNPAQLLVQASNINAIISLHPTNAPSVMRRILALRSIAFLNPADPSYEKIVRIASKAALMDYDEFEPMLRAWHSSGWAYTSRSSADARTAMRGLSPGGSFMQGLRTVDKFGLIPFTEGELWSRMYGFLDSYTRLSSKAKRAGEIVDWTRPDRINDLIREATRVSFNYTSANRAWWQKGILSVPTQFLQVPAKFYEALLMPIVGGKRFKSQFTRMERVRLVLGQAILFGGMGIPFMPYLKDAFYNWLTQEGSDGAIFPEVTKDEVALITGGLTDWMSSELIQLATDQDVHPSLASRMSLANGFDMLIGNLTQGDAQGISKALLGAFGGVVGQQFIPAIEVPIRVHSIKLGAGTYTAETAWIHLNRLATFTKSWDNVQTARLWSAYKAILSESGDRIMEIDPEGEDQMLIWLKSVGIETHERYAAAKLKDWNKKNNPEKEIDNALESASNLLMYYISDRKMDDPVEAANFSAEMNYITESLASEEDKAKFATKWSNMLFEGKTAVAKTYQDYLNYKIEYNDKKVLSAPPLEGVFIQERLNTNP